MWIKEIILEGFKSYAQRTVITGFDMQFNAITGLNGSGKSNILDAILFCLGLSKEYDILRIKKPQELIYKNAAAGITKAEVTIVFDNMDKTNSPSGYEDCDKITVTRQISSDKSKYFINGHAETQKNYKNMFRSVHLNIDNPHFLVAQGRITKVINLKPSELISMLEETAGTSLYNEKKREAQRTIEKKEEKVKQCTDIIDLEIKPQMDQLIREKNIFLIWRTQESEKLRLTETIFSYEYYSKNLQLNSKKEENEELIVQLKDAEERVRNQRSEVSQVETDLAKRVKDNQLAADLQKIEADYKRVQAQLAKYEKDLEFSKKSKEQMENEKFKLDQSVKQSQAEIERLENRGDACEKTLQQMKTELEEKKELHEEQQRQKKLADQGQGTNEEAQSIIESSLRDTQKNLNSYKSDLAQIQDRMKRIEDQINNQRSLFEKAQKDSTQIQTKMTILINEIKNLEQELENGSAAEHEFNKLKQLKNEAEQTVMELRLRVNQFPPWMSLDLSRLGNYDRNRIYGKVFELIDIKDDTYMKALEQGAGNKLNNVVVDDENTAAYLLKNNILNTHVYIIPNKKIQVFQQNEHLNRAADEISHNLKGFAKPAVELITFGKNVENAIRFVFGTFYVASSIDIANQIAYHPSNKYKAKVVTKDGDIVDPSGTITGGYINDKSQIMPKFKQLAKVCIPKFQFCQIKAEMVQEERKNEKITAEFNEKKKDVEYHQQLRQELESKKYEFEQLQQKQKRSSNIKYQADQQKLENEKNDTAEEQKRIENLLKNVEQKYRDLQNDQKQMKAGKNANQLIKEQIEKTAKEIEKLKQNINKYKQDLQGIQVDQENCKQEMAKGTKKIAEEEKNINEISSEIRNLTQQVAESTDQFADLEERKKKLELQTQHSSATIKRLQQQQQEQRAYLVQLEEEQKRIESERQKNTKDIHELKQELKTLEQKYDFIRQNKNDLQNFELSEQYAYLKTIDFEQSRERLQRLEHEQTKLQKQVNFKVEAMTEQVEKEFKQLEDKKKQLLRDKEMLVDNMVELDDKKTQTLEKCFVEVSKYFSAIFTSIYPEGSASLSKLESKPIEEGLELNVSINHQLKQLAELSGGQRSLVALSFILALLKYKPAPFYILDEVDSALDLSHTENIGYMLSQNFKQSQFLLISLKEGMYQNANMLFKVSFTDGVSKIERFALKDKKKDHHKKKDKIQS